MPPQIESRSTLIQSSNFHDSQKVEATQVSLTDEWINKRWYIHSGTRFSLKNEGSSDTGYNTD